MDRIMTLVHLFISSFKSNIKSVIKVSFALLCVVLIGKMLRYALTDDISSYTRVTFNELYNQEDNIDILFLGSSRMFRTIDTDIADDFFNANTFNAGSSSQQIDGSYAVLVEAAKHNDIKEVYMDLYYVIASDVIAERTNAVSTYLIGDYLKPSYNKYRFLINATSKENWINTFVVARRNWRKLFDPKYIIGTLRNKNSETYKSYAPINNGNEYYVKKGYVANEDKLEIGTFSSKSDFSPIEENQISEDAKKSLIDIINFCRKNDIKLTFVSVPLPDFRLLTIGYDSYIEQIKALVNPYGIEYVDFSLCKRDVFSGEDDLFYDSSHLNKEGAELFSKLFCEYFTGKLNKNIFYDSYAEKISLMPDKIYGLVLAHDDDEECIHAKIIATDNEDMLFNIYLKAKDENEEDVIIKIQNFDSNREFIIPSELSGKCNIEWKYRHKSEIMAVHSFSF